MPTFNTRQIVESSPSMRATTAAYTDNFMLTVGGVLNVCDNLTKTDCNIIIKTNILRQIQLSTDTLDGNTIKLINDDLLTHKPYATLSTDVSDDSKFSNLEFLQNLPDLKSLNIFIASNEQIGKVNKYLNLTDLSIGTTRIPITGIEKQIHLKKLFIYEKPKDIEIIGKMDWIQNLTFSMQTLKSLQFITTLKHLTELHFMLGGTKNLIELPNIGKIEKLSFTMVKKLFIDDLSPINQMKYLKEIKFDTQPHLTDLDWLNNKTIKTDIKYCKNFKP